MTDDKRADLVKLLTVVELRLQTMPRCHPDGTPKTTEEIKREVWQWLSLAAARTDGPSH